MSTDEELRRQQPPVISKISLEVEGTIIDVEPIRTIGGNISVRTPRRESPEELSEEAFVQFSASMKRADIPNEYVRRLWYVFKEFQRRLDVTSS